MMRQGSGPKRRWTLSTSPGIVPGMFKHKPIACASLLILTGCIPMQTQPEAPTQQVPASPFAEAKKQPPARVSYAPASQEASYRVVQIKDQLAGKNPQYGLKPFALAIGSPESEVFHVGNTIYITEGLVRVAVGLESVKDICADLDAGLSA